MASPPGRDIIVVAASAGGLMPLRAFLAGLPADLPASVLVVLHIPATGGQALPGILDRSGPLAAGSAQDGEMLTHGRVYVAPADRHVLVVNGSIQLSQEPRQNGVRPAADPMFRSAALYGGPRVLAVVLSGTLDDAARGCGAVEQHGGRVLVQDPAEAAYPGMPGQRPGRYPARGRAARYGPGPAGQPAGHRDQAGHPRARPSGDRQRTLRGVTSPDLKPDFDELLRMLKDTRGFDFSGYKPSTLQRRIHRRMTALDLPTFGEYRDYLELQPEEFTELFNSMLINVTGFFRDPAAWQTLSDVVLPEMLSAKGPRTPIRVWSAGCATGEEAYTLAMVLVEALGPEQFRERVKIYATDLDEDALQYARYGTYDAQALDDVPEVLRGNLFRAGRRPVLVPARPPPAGDLRP